MSGKTPVIYTVYAVIAYMYLFTVNIILITESREVRDVFIHVNTIFITEPREFRVRGNASDLLQPGFGGTGLLLCYILFYIIYILMYSFISQNLEKFVSGGGPVIYFSLGSVVQGFFYILLYYMYLLHICLCIHLYYRI